MFACHHKRNGIFSKAHTFGCENAGGHLSRRFIWPGNKILFFLFSPAAGRYHVERGNDWLLFPTVLRYQPFAAATLAPIDGGGLQGNRQPARLQEAIQTIDDIKMDGVGKLVSRR